MREAESQSPEARWPDLGVDEVFHYTDSGGLHGIVSSDKLRATEGAALNDLNEVGDGLRFVHDWLTQQAQTSLGPNLAETFVHGRDLFTRVYVLSASLLPDDAGQWRNYADGGRGYAVGIDPTVPLAVVAEGSRPPLTRLPDLGVMFAHSGRIEPWRKCLYFDDDRLQALDELLAQKEVELADVRSTGYGEEDLAAALQLFEQEAVADFAGLASLIKDPGWSGEQEVRAVATSVSQGRFLKYRPGVHGITGYFEVATATADQTGPGQARVYDGEHRPLPITSVRTGPLVHGSSEETLRYFVEGRSPEVRVLSSRVGLR